MIILRAVDVNQLDPYNTKAPWRNLDVFGNENVSLTFQVDEIRNLKNKNASYSKSFNLPATKRNNDFFEHYYDLDRYDYSFNAYKSARVELLVDGIVILEGFMKLLGTLEKQTEITYNVVIFNDVANLIDTLGDATIRDLSFSDLTHAFTYDNVVASWFAIDLGNNPVDYTYSFVNDGNLQLGETGNLGYIPHRHWMLNISLKNVIDKIFNYAGFSYDSNFFNSSQFRKLYFDTSVIKNYGTEVEPLQIKASGFRPPTFQIGTTDVTHTGIPIGNGYDNAVAVNFANETGDVNNQFDETTSTFTAQSNCTLTIGFNVSYVNGTGNNVTYTVWANDIAFHTFMVSGIDMQNPPLIPNIGNSFAMGTFPLIAGETVQIKISIDNDSVFANNIYPIGIKEAGTTNIALSVTNADIGSLIHAQRGDIKLADIIADMFSMFNLIATDKGNKELKIEPYVNYISDDIIDWTPKVDINEFDIETIDIPSQLVFKHARDEDDYFLGKYESENGIEYGTHIVNTTSTNGEQEIIELKVFAAPFTKTIQGTEIVAQHIGTIIDDEGTIDGFKNLPRIVYRIADILDPTSLTPTPNALVSLNVEFTNTQLNSYPQLHHYTDLTQDAISSDDSFLFGTINPTAIENLNQQPVDTLFFRYWRTYINEKYNTDTRILKCGVRLSATDILNLDFSKKYRIQHQLYRLNKVDYNTDKNKIARVEFIRI